MSKHVKRILAFLTMFVLACMAFTCSAESGNNVKPFTPTLTGKVNKTVRDWMGNSENRAMLTVLLTLDLVGEVGSDLSPELTKTSYVVRNGAGLIVYMHAGDQDILASYTPMTKTAAYALLDATPDEVMKIAISAQNPDEYYENDIADIASVLQLLNDALNDK